MKYVSLIVFLFFLGISYGQIPEDKLKHLGAGVVIGGLGGVAANQIFNGDRYWTWSAAVGSSLAAGIAKEGYDSSKGGPWDNGDILYTVAGGVISGLIFELFVNKDGCRRRGRPCKYYSMRIDPLQKSYLPTSLLTLNFSEDGSRNVAAHIQAQYVVQTTPLP